MYTKLCQGVLGLVRVNVVGCGGGQRGLGGGLLVLKNNYVISHIIETHLSM